MKFSIVTAVKNAEDLLPITLASIANQQLDHEIEVEHIVIDGKSDDNSLQIVKLHGSSLHHPFSFSIISELDTGIYDAMDKGRALATGDFLLFLNAGDEFNSKSTIREVAQCIQVNQTAEQMYSIYYGKTLIYTKYTNWVVPLEPHDGDRCKKNGMRYYYPHHQSIFYPKQFYSKYGYDKSFVIYGDFDYTIRACSSFPSQYIPVNISKVQLGGFSTNKLTFSLLKKFYLDEIKLQNMHQNIYTKADKISSFVKYLVKYTLDNTIGVDRKHYAMGIIQGRRK